MTRLAALAAAAVLAGCSASLGRVGALVPDADGLGLKLLRPGVSGRSCRTSIAGLPLGAGEPEGPPPTQRPGMGDHMTGLGLAGAIAAALFARERSGIGQEIGMSLFASGIWMLASDIQAAITTGYCHTPGGRRAAPNPLFNFYRTSDGRWLHLVMLQPDRHWRAFCRAVGREDLVDDARFASAPVRFQHCRELIAILDPLFAARPLAEWAEALDGADCYWGKVQTVEEVSHDAQAEAIGAFADTALPDGRPLRVVKSPVAFGATPSTVAGPAPELGQHTEEVLLEAGFGWEDIARLKDAGALG